MTWISVLQKASRTGASAGTGGQVLPPAILHYVLRSSGLHQLLLVTLTVTLFLLEVVPLELQRRIVNDVVKNRDYSFVIVLCAVYAGTVIVQGGLKLTLNIYRSWVSERATRDLRRRVRALVNPAQSTPSSEASGIEVSMIVAEVEPVGGFVGVSISEPLLQAGILLTVIAYMIHLDVWMSLAALTLFVPQLIFVPLMQGAINRRTGARVWILRKLGISLVSPFTAGEKRENVDAGRIDRVFELNMGIFKLKFTMNFLMNLCTHLQIITALLLGGWLVLSHDLEIGGVVAFISAIGRLNDPWGDLVNYFRDVVVTQVKYRLLAEAVNTMSRGGMPAD